jgi:hypothetical protein
LASPAAVRVGKYPKWWITFGICGMAPRASHAVRTMQAPASARVRARAAKGRTHQTYQGIVQPRVRTVASMTKPAAPGSHERRHVTTAVAPTAASASTPWASVRSWGVIPPWPASAASTFGTLSGPTSPSWMLVAGRWPP